MLAQLFDSPKKRIIAAVVAVAVLGAGAAIVVATGGEEAAPVTTTTVATTTTVPPTTVPPPVAPLTGLTGDYGDRINRPAVFVKMDNHPNARPQSGLAQADIVFEERVEGNISRLAAVFQSSGEVEIGPVRSTRSTDLGLVSLFGRPLYASSGGNGGILGQLREANVVDIGHNVSGQGFRRDSGRPAPYNLFTSLDALYGKAPELPPPPAPVFTYRAEGEALATGAAPAGGVALRFGGGEISRFAWDAASTTWLRSQAGTPHVDAAGVQLAPKNVVVLEIAYDMSGQGNSVPHGIVTGEGRALVFTDGHVIEGRWVRPGPADALQLLAPDGSPIKLTPGQTFIELPSVGGAVLL